MAGRTRLASLLHQLQVLKNEYEADHIDDLEFVARLVEGGRDLRDINHQLKTKAGVELDDDKLGRYLRDQYSETFDARMRLARKRGSHAKVEHAQAIVDDAPETNEGIRKAEARAKSKQWAAERANKEELGNVNQPIVQVTIGGLHLDALRKTVRAPVVQARIAASSEGAVDVEQVDEPAEGE